MPALSSYVIEPIWEQFRALLPERKVDHPLGDSTFLPTVTYWRKL